MTNRLAVWLFVLIALFFVLDHFVLHLGAPVWLMRQMTHVIRWIAFWR